MVSNAIEIQALNKTYAASGKSPEKTALQDINLQIPQGSIYGLLGPNGAGKSTIINILAGLVVKSSGLVKIWDIDIDKDSRNAKAAIGIVPQEINFDPFFTPRQILEIQAGLYGVPAKERWTDALLDLVDLTNKANAYSRSLSGGMKRRLMVAKALVHKPPILVLDEPTAGVDVELRQMLWANVRKLNQQGVTILLTTHYLEEAEELCDRVAIINHGRIITDDTKENLLSQIDFKTIRFTFSQPIVEVPSSLAAYAPTLEKNKILIIRYSPKYQNVGDILYLVNSLQNSVVDMVTEQGTLEDVFLQLTKK